MTTEDAPSRAYRLYFLNAAGRITGVAEFVSETDEDALGAAVMRRDGRAMELWSLDRQVAVFPVENRQGFG